MLHNILSFELYGKFNSILHILVSIDMAHNKNIPVGLLSVSCEQLRVHSGTI